MVLNPLKCHYYWQVVLDAVNGPTSEENVSFNSHPMAGYARAVLIVSFATHLIAGWIHPTKRIGITTETNARRGGAGGQSRRS